MDRRDPGVQRRSFDSAFADQVLQEPQRIFLFEPPGNDLSGFAPGQAMVTLGAHDILLCP